MVEMVAQITSRMFGGKAISRDPRWLNACIGFATDGFIGAQYLKKFPRFLHPVVAPFVEEIKKIQQHHQTSRDLLCPLIQARESSVEKEKSLDALQWMIDESRGAERNPHFIAKIMLKLSFASIHTSSATPVQVIYDLCAMPEYIEPLRQEVQSVLGEREGWDGKTLGKLHKLDSIMAESQRFNPLLLSE